MRRKESHHPPPNNKTTTGIKVRSEVVVREMAAPSAFSFGPMSTPSASQAWAVAGVAGTGMGMGEGVELHLSPPPS